MTEQTKEQEKEVASSSNQDILDAVKELTGYVSDLVENVADMRKELNLKKRAGIFDQKGVS